MSFDLLTYVDLASRLIDSRDNDIEEAYLRASISRAFYGVFGALWQPRRDRLARLPGSKHQALIMWLRNSANPFERRLAFRLDRLRRLRNVADYEERAVVTRERAEKAYSLAARIQRQVRAQ